MPFEQLQELLDSVAADLDPAIDYIAQLCSGGYRTPNGIKQADNAEQLQRACGLLLGEASIIWKAAGGSAGQQPYSHDILSCTRCNITCSMFAAFVQADALAVRVQACKAMSLRRYWRPNSCWLSSPTLPHTPWRTCWHTVHLTNYIRHHPQPTQIPS